MRLKPVHHHFYLIGKVGRGGFENSREIETPVRATRYRLNVYSTLFPRPVTAFACDRVWSEEICPVGARRIVSQPASDVVSRRDFVKEWTMLRSEELTLS